VIGRKPAGVQEEDAKAADDDRGQHPFQNGEVTKTELVDDDIRVRHARAVEKPAEDEAKQQGADEKRGPA
jgi:hypothetical protein